MRVLIISQYYPPDMGGGATRAYNAAEGLARNGCDVTVISAVPHYPHGNIPSRYRWRPVTIEKQNRVRVIRTFIPPLKSEGLFRRFILFLSFMISSLFAFPFVNGVDIIWTANPNITSSYIGKIFATLSRCPLAQNVDDLWPDALFDLGLSRNSIFAKISEILARVSYRFANALTPISPGYVPVLSSKYGVSPSSIQVVKAGVDLDRFPFSFKKPNDIFQLLYIGAFSPAYNFDQIFIAASVLVEENDIVFVIQGGGELFDYLKSLQAKFNLSNVKIINKIVSRNEVAYRLLESDALLLPLAGTEFIELGISSKLYEYQAANRPILCCSLGEAGRYVAESDSGIVISPGDTKSLVEAILYLRDNPEIAARYGNNGRTYVQENLSIDSIGSSLKHVFEHCRSLRNG